MNIESVASHYKNLRETIAGTIVGQDALVSKTIVALFSGGHVLLQWVPGLAKTLFAETLARTIDAKFSRIQFTPDLLPSDITGSEIYRPQSGEFFIKNGPIVANIVLADEMNRAPSKVQSALLEAMQEQKLSIASETVALPKPFFVIATVNPIDQEGTYELPEASLDRFFFQIEVGYPTKREEMEIALRQSHSVVSQDIHVLTGAEILEIQKTIDQEVFVDEKIYSYAIDIVRATRESEVLTAFAEKYGISDVVFFGASPRASIALIRAAKTIAACGGRNFVTPDDIKSIAHEVLRHRIRLSFAASGSGIDTDTVIDAILDSVIVP